MSKKIEDGGPAIASGMVPHPTDPTKAVPASNLTVRDWFAGQALVGIAEPMMQAGFKQKIQVERQAENMAAAAYLIADAMLAARKAGA